MFIEFHRNDGYRTQIELDDAGPLSSDFLYQLSEWAFACLGFNMSYRHEQRHGWVGVQIEPCGCPQCQKNNEQNQSQAV